jgi:general secretion pathway protein C
MRIVEFYRSDTLTARSFHHNRRMLARLSAFVIWSFVAATAVFWALRFGVSSPRVPAYAVPIDRPAPARGDLARLLGAAPVVATANEARPEAPSRFRLLGVMAPKSKSSSEASANYGFALIAVDGKPAKAFSVGAPLGSGLVLQSVGLRSASLGPSQGRQSMLLELPALSAPAARVLSAPGVAMTMAPAAARPAPVPPPAMASPPAPILGAALPATMQPQTLAAPANPPPNPSLPSANDARAQ